MNKRLVVGAVLSAMLAVVGVAYAQKAEKAPAEKAPAKGGDKKGDMAGGNAGAPAQPEQQAMQMPTVAPELAAAAKAMKGAWKCTGEVKEMMGQPAHKNVGTMTWKADLDGFWLTGSYVEKKTKENPMPYSFIEHRTYDANSKKWLSVSVDNMGGWGQAVGVPEGDTKVKWEGKSSMGGMTMWGRGVEEHVTAKEVHFSGDMSMDGKQWMPIYDITCKK